MDCFVRKGFDISPRFEKKRSKMFGGFSTNRQGMSRWGDYSFELVGRVAFLYLFLVPSLKSCGFAVRSVAFETRPVVAPVVGLQR